MAELSVEGIETLIDKYKKTYQTNPSILRSGYNQENQTVADYEGRQLLELIQNADDAKSDIVYINLNTEQHELTISNNGEEFSVEGVESLMYTGLTTKNKLEYIGNKGLGFRSVLSWVNWVEVRTRKVSFRFSREYSTRYFRENLLNDLIKELLEKERLEHRLEPNEIPIATLAFPDLVDEKEKEYTTSVILQFKEEQLEPIEEQLSMISEETLLFLPNIQRIVIVKDGELIKELHKTVRAENLVTINDKTWNIYRKEDQVYNNEVKFNYAIAWQNDLSDEGYFYNYFKTDVPTGLPCIIHATFNLTNNRKEINNTADNKHLLNCIADSLAEISSSRLKKAIPDWDAYSFLTASSKNSRELFRVFYDSIWEKREEIGCYPTLDGRYITKDLAVYQGAGFSEWVLENEFGTYFPNLLLPSELFIIYVQTQYSFKQWDSIVNELNPYLNLENRVAFLKLIIKNESGYFNRILTSEKKLPLLLNTKSNVVSADIQVFTNDVKDANYDFPEYLKDISFINYDLYESIKQELKEEIVTHRRENESGDSRAIKRLLEPAVNIGSDDIIVVIQYIVRKTNREIKISNDPKRIILEMVQLLFSIFNGNKERRGNLTTIGNIPLISRDGTFVNSDDLYFGKDYAIGESAEQIFTGIRTDNNYLAGNEIWEIDTQEENIINFFSWLNVNLYSKYEKIEKEFGRWEKDSYVDFLFKRVDHTRTDVHKNYSIESISGIEDILANKKFSLEKLIAWISKDGLFERKLPLNNDDNFFTKFNGETREYAERPSYLLFQIYKSGITKNVIASIPVDGFRDIKTLDREHPLLRELKAYEIDKVLDLLHIKNSFNDLDPSLVYSLLNSFGDEDNIQNSQQVYKLFYEYFRVNETTQLKNFEADFENIKYICRKGGVGKDFSLQPVSNVYYSDNKQLPQKILDRYWFINLPKRIGENRVKKFFGIKLIKDVVSDIEISGEVRNNLEAEMTKYLNGLKPYMLCYRLGSLKKEENKDDAIKSIKAFKVQLFKKAKFRLGGVTFNELDNNEFIPIENSFLLKHSNERSLDDLKRDPEFCDAIAEMVCISFKVNELKNTYRRIFKDGIKEAQHIITVDEKLDLLKQAKKYLGVSDEEKDFWSAILEKDFKSIQEAEGLKQIIEKELSVTLPIDYSQIDFSNLGTNLSVDFLKWLKTVRTFNLETVLKKTDLQNYHQENIKDAIRDVQSTFEKLLWKKASDSKDVRNKKEFIKRLNSFEPEFEKGAFEQFLKVNQYNLEPDYGDAVNQYTLNNYYIDLKEIIDAGLIVEKKYKDLFTTYTFGDDVEDMMNIIKSDTPEIYSCLYFDGFDEEIKKTLELQQAEKIKDIKNNANADNEDASNLILIETNIQSVIPSNNGRSGKKGGSHNSKSERKKAVAGKKEEEKVVTALKANGYEVSHTSKSTDSKHYDIEYKKPGETTWRFLEVKKDSGGYFFMSKWEQQTALKEKEKYDLAIVEQDNIRIIKSPFDFGKGETFEVNSKFYPETIEFKINFQVEEK